MKKLLTLATLALVLFPIAAEAAAGAVVGDIVENPTFTGFVTATNLNPFFFSINGDFNFVASAPSTIQYAFRLNTNLQLLGIGNSSGVSEIPILGFTLQCAPYNPVIAAVQPGDYPYFTKTNGIAGGTVTFHEYKLTGAIVTVGTIVLPTSPHGGPYVNSVTSTLATPYIPTFGSTFDAQVTTIDPTPSQGYSICGVQATL